MTSTLRHSIQTAYILSARIARLGNSRRPRLCILLEDFTRLRCTLTGRGRPYTGAKFNGEPLAPDDRRWLSALYNEGLRVAVATAQSSCIASRSRAGVLPERTST